MPQMRIHFVPPDPLTAKSLRTATPSLWGSEPRPRRISPGFCVPLSVNLPVLLRRGNRRTQWVQGRRRRGLHIFQTRIRVVTVNQGCPEYIFERKVVMRSPVNIHCMYVSGPLRPLRQEVWPAACNRLGHCRRWDLHERAWGRSPANSTNRSACMQ